MRTRGKSCHFHKVIWKYDSAVVRYRLENFGVLSVEQQFCNLTARQTIRRLLFLFNIAQFCADASSLPLDHNLRLVDQTAAVAASEMPLFWYSLLHGVYYFRTDFLATIFCSATLCQLGHASSAFSTGNIPKDKSQRLIAFFFGWRRRCMFRSIAIG